MQAVGAAVRTALRWAVPEGGGLAALTKLLQQGHTWYVNTLADGWFTVCYKGIVVYQWY